MKKHSWILLMTVCYWIFFISGNVYSAHHHGGGGHHQHHRHHHHHHGGVHHHTNVHHHHHWSGNYHYHWGDHFYYYGGRRYHVHHPGGFFWSDIEVVGCSCVRNGNRYKCSAADAGYGYVVIRNQKGVCKVIESKGKTPATIAGPFKTREAAEEAKERKCPEAPFKPGKPNVPPIR